MQTYTVHEPPSPPPGRIDRAQGMIFVRDGFSWSAALFAPIWLLAHRLWWPLVGYVAAVAAFSLIEHNVAVHPGWITLATLALNLAVGFEADALRRWGLARRGWTTVGSVSGKNAEDCERRFFDIWLPTQPALAPAPGAGSGAALGAR